LLNHCRKKSSNNLSKDLHIIDWLAYITDTYGPRMWGSATLEQVIYEMQSMAVAEGFENVHL